MKIYFGCDANKVIVDSGQVENRGWLSLAEILQFLRDGNIVYRFFEKDREIVTLLSSRLGINVPISNDLKIAYLKRREAYLEVILENEEICFNFYERK